MTTRFAAQALFGLGAALTTAAITGAASSARPADPAPVLVTDTNDVMNGASPKVPAFPKLARKPGCLRGFVKDARGRPLAGAKVLATASFTGGFGTGASAVTDARGYYEVRLPAGVARVWCAGYAVTYNGVRVANTLRPADGTMADFPSKQGAVEHFVYLPYGIVNEASASDSPHQSGTYYGASFTLGYSLNTYGYPVPGTLPVGATVELTLTPQGPLIDGSRGRAFVIRKKLTDGVYFQVNNVPVGRYRIAATLTHENTTEPLRLKENGASPRKGGLEPKQADGAATVIFRSASSDPGTIRVSGGNMERLELLVERIEKKGATD